MECPARAIRIRGGGYRVDGEKCISCGKCAQVCHLSLPYDENAAPFEPSAHERKELSCDVLVIGAGGVGLGASARAAFLGQNFDNGASLGGIETDAMFHVTKQAGGVFENLYCAGDCATYSPREDKGAIGLCGGLGGSWASGYQIANYIFQSLT